MQALHCEQRAQGPLIKTTDILIEGEMAFFGSVSRTTRQDSCHGEIEVAAPRPPDNLDAVAQRQPQRHLRTTLSLVTVSSPASTAANSCRGKLLCHPTDPPSGFFRTAHNLSLLWLIVRETTSSILDRLFKSLLHLRLPLATPIPITPALQPYSLCFARVCVQLCRKETASLSWRRFRITALLSMF